MKKELIDEQLEQVTGGTVIISKDAMMVGFDTLGEMYNLVNCTYRDARNFRDDLIDAHQDMNNAE